MERKQVLYSTKQHEENGVWRENFMLKRIVAIAFILVCGDATHRANAVGGALCGATAVAAGHRPGGA
jgi:hypothetical protein